MNDNKMNKRKALSEDELLKVSGGHGMCPMPPCKDVKKQKNCENRGDECEWDTVTSTCMAKEISVSKKMAT